MISLLFIGSGHNGGVGATRFTLAGAVLTVHWTRRELGYAMYRTGAVEESVVLRFFSPAPMLFAMLCHESHVNRDCGAVTAASGLLVAVSGAAQYHVLAALRRKLVPATAGGVADSEIGAGRRVRRPLERVGRLRARSSRAVGSLVHLLSPCSIRVVWAIER
ncbi:hypothetical protein [Nonomuraea helvata]|uniref:Uncharacterized protein n=1 Tax=Nonomuraea helvata TaxID=37484 RepID=A0ABV5SHX3_9ACTN